MPVILPSLLHRIRRGLLVMLLVVLPLQSVTQLIAGLQGHRHVHTQGAQASDHDAWVLALARPLRAALDRLHAGQDPRLQAPSLAWVASRGPAGEMHQHGGVFHKHSHDTADVLDVGDATDESLQAGATAFLAWLPAALALPAGEGGDRPAAPTLDWRDRVVAPPLTPPRG